MFGSWIFLLRICTNIKALSNCSLRKFQFTSYQILFMSKFIAYFSPVVLFVRDFLTNPASDSGYTALIVRRLRAVSWNDVARSAIFSFEVLCRHLVTEWRYITRGGGDLPGTKQGLPTLHQVSAVADNCKMYVLRTVSALSFCSVWYASVLGTMSSLSLCSVW